MTEQEIENSPHGIAAMKRREGDGFRIVFVLPDVTGFLTKGILWTLWDDTKNILVCSHPIVIRNNIHEEYKFGTDFRVIESSDKRTLLGYVLDKVYES